MRVFKKIMYIVLAFVPIFPLLLFAVCNVGNTNGVALKPFGTFVIGRLVDGEAGLEQYMVFVEKDSVLSSFMDGVVSINQNVFSHNVTVSEDDESSYFHSAFGVPYGDHKVYVFLDQSLQETRFIGKIVGVYQWFVDVGISPPPYVVFIFAYLCYMLFIHVSFMIFDIIVFVPKKISEILEG